MSLPRLDVHATAADWRTALAQHGAAVVHDPDVADVRLDAVLADARHLFALATTHGESLALARSPHFRGYSRMDTARDHRVQFHFGCERSHHQEAAAVPFWRLQGPNLWPPEPGLRARMLAYLDVVAGIGRRVLARLAEAFGTSASGWLGDDPYLLLKCIAYHAQVDSVPARPGVAAHVDFSLLTLTLQDDVGGLQVQHRDGTWIDVEPRPGTWLLHAGELLAYVTGNAIAATPHRVVNPSTRRQRVSLPMFLNPSLSTTLARGSPFVPPPTNGEHVHAVLDLGHPPATLAFGPAEWRRKGRNRWCATCCAEAR